ncbi:MAG: fatty acid desaturase [Planctomycetales bacterium]|nr:fatty acid desaturase [Planctomycetales bacterium]
MSSESASCFSVSQARDIIRDLFEHRAWIYWTDMVVTLAVGYTAAAIYLTAELFSPLQIVCYFVAGFALFRAGSFIHEIVHMPGRQMRAFKIGWNILAGIPMLMPSFFYGNHVDHHSSNYYGTGQDGEYLPLGSGTLREIWHFYLQVVFLPIAVFLRFAVITPLSFFHAGLREWALQRCSSFVINLRYRRDVPNNAPRRLWATIEFFCFLRAAGIIVLPLAGGAPWTRVLLLYNLALMTLGLNYIRNLVAHRYESTGEPMSHVDQLEDSVNITGVPIVTELFFPLNLRYHALHHLFPTLPYHNLRQAHRRLIQQLPADSSYHRTVYPGFLLAATEVVARAWRNRWSDAGEGAERWYRNRVAWYKGKSSMRTIESSAPLRRSA